MEAQDKKTGRNLIKEGREWVLTLGGAILISLLIQNYAFAQVKVEQHSMDNTLREGQRLIENRFVYRFYKPERGDIVIVKSPEDSKRLVKRLIGLPGDVIDMKDGSLYVNGVRQSEPYVKGKTYAWEIPIPLTVPEGACFVLGDNREVSKDSRTLGAIPLSSLEGKAVARLWPLGQAALFQ